MRPSELILEHVRNIYKPEEYPALHAQMQEWRTSRPLEGIRILDATPPFTNTLLKYVPLLEAGAEVTAAFHDLIPYDPAIPSLLEKWGIPHVKNAVSGEYDCILDCGGLYASLKPKYGFVELTRSGYYHYSKAEKPVIFVDDSHIKVIETCLGTGDGFLRGMKQCGYTDFKNKNVVVFGFGKVGRGIAFYAHREGAEIQIVDSPEIPLPDYAKRIDRFDISAVQQAVRNAWCVVTATGIYNAMNGNGAAEILREFPGVLIAAMGIENEWGGSLPPERILNHGMPLNFLLKEPTRLRYIDPTMALSNAAVLELKTRTLPDGLQKVNPDVEARYWSIVEKYGIIADELKEAGL